MPPEAVSEAIDAYEAATQGEPEQLVPYWKLLRALWFRAEFATTDPTRQRADYERARVASERALTIVARRANAPGSLDTIPPMGLRAQLAPQDVSDVARLYFWSAINLGAWARLAGLLQAVRAGVANRLHQYAGYVVALDPGVDDGGALRLLSRLHAELPRVPLLSGWVDRTQVLPFAERAHTGYPTHPGNGYVLALALLEAAPARRAEALTLLDQAANLQPRSDELLEDLSIRRDARARLATERAH